MPPARLALAALLLAALPASALEITIRPGAGLASNLAALAAFDRAAALWEAQFSDPIEILIDADLAALGPNVLGEASSTMLFGDNFAELRDAMVADALAHGGDAVVEALPTFAQLSVLLPDGRTAFDSLTATQANLKALGFTGLAAISGHEEDARITFSSAFAFDFDNRDGVDFFSYDFETAAAHEIGHALGFLSSVDDVDFTTAAQYSQVVLTPLDLFRFGAGAGQAPSTLTEFTAKPRELRPGEAALFADLAQTWRFSTGANPNGPGDGGQASHWRDDELAGQPFIGLLDPTLANGVAYGPTPADFRALDVIGYDAVPEPASAALLALGAVALLGRARRRVG